MSNTRTDIRHTQVRLRRWRKGNELSAAHLDESPQAIEQLFRVAASTREIVRSATKVQETRQFRILSVHADHLICEELDGRWDARDPEGAPIRYVAKPWSLQRTPFDTAANGGDAYERNGITYDYDTDDTTGQTRTATLTSSGQTQTEAVVKSYQPDDPITATSNVRGHRLVVKDGNGDDVDVVWLDDNRDARAWGQT